MHLQKRRIILPVVALVLPLTGCSLASNGLDYSRGADTGGTPAVASMGIPKPGMSCWPTKQLPIPGEPYGYAPMPCKAEPAPAPAVAEPPPPPPPPPPCEMNENRVTLAGCKQGDVVILRGVNFDFDKATLTLNAKGILDLVSGELTKRPDIKVEIDGHTDGKGAVNYNQKLSERRAASVRSYLIARGIAANRMTSAGFGKSKPIADNATDEGRAINRRVELKVTEAAAGAPTPVVESPLVPAAAPLPTAAAPDSAPASGGTSISIVQFAFAPETLTVSVGSVVTWTNKDDATHTVKFGDGASGNLGTGSSYRRAFSAPGIYPYQCGVHPYMKGQIVVK